MNQKMHLLIEKKRIFAAVFIYKQRKTYESIK
jgi:hypothetical protein